MITRLAVPDDRNRLARLAWVAETVARPLARLPELIRRAR